VSVFVSSVRVFICVSFILSKPCRH